MRKFDLMNTVKMFHKDERGNFAAMVGLLVPVIMMAGSLSIDIANQTALKGRVQMASDSVSLAVATRIANGTLTIADAEQFGIDLFNAHMSGETGRFSNLTWTPSVDIVETVDGGAKTWDVEIAATAYQDVSGFATFFSKNQLGVSITSTAVTGTDEEQGALSMAVIIDVSGSMGWELDSSSTTLSSATSTVSTVLGITDSDDAEEVAEDLADAIDDYDLTLEDVTWIVENYVYDDCEDMADNSSERATFLSTIGVSGNSKKKAKKICKRVTYATDVGASQSDLIANIDDIYTASYAVANPEIKLDALKDAAAALFAQFNTADPESQYVRTGITSYEYGVRGDEDMEWGTSSAAQHVEDSYASGGTASTDSFDWAYDQLKSSNTTEPDEHADKNGQVPERFILFMTDGDNNNNSDDTATENLCDDAKADGIIVYAVAFAAPSGGQALLSDCATSSEHYFEPETAEELIAAFTNIGSETSKTLTRLIN